MSPAPHLRAVIYAPGPDLPVARIWLDLCAEHCARRGYQVVAAVVGGRWGDATSMLDRGDAEVLVIGRWDHMPADTRHIEAVLGWG